MPMIGWTSCNSPPNFMRFILFLLLLSALGTQAAQPKVGGTELVQSTGGTFNGTPNELATTVSGTNVVIDVEDPLTVWETSGAAAERMTLSGFPSSGTTGKKFEVIINGQPGSQWTNVVDNIIPDGPWGNLISTTTHLYFSWVGPASALHMIQDPAVGISRPAQLVANTDNWNPTGFDMADVIEFSTDASRNITGFKGMPDGRSRTFHNNGTQNAVFKNSVTSTATNQLKLNADITLAAAQSIIFRYDLTAQRWFAVGGIGGSSPTTFVGFSDTSANLRGALTDETGTGVAVFGTAPTISSPTIGTLLNLPFSTANTLAKFDGSQDLVSIANGGANTLVHGTSPPAYSAVVEADLSLTDVTTANASTSAHGFVKKLPNDANQFYNGLGNFALPGIAGTVINTGASIVGAVPDYSDTTGTNLIPSKITITQSTNLNAGVVFATNKISVVDANAGVLTLYDSDASNFANIVAAPSTVTNLQWIMPDRPGSGFVQVALANGTNQTLSVGPIDNYAGYASGTVYSLTTTPALIDFGTTDPTITILVAGTYRLDANIGLKYNGATFAANQTVTLKMRKTSGTPADVTSASRTVVLQITTTLTGTIETTQLPPVFFTAAANDVIQVWGSIGVAPSVGSVDCTSAEIIAVRVQ